MDIYAEEGNDFEPLVILKPAKKQPNQQPKEAEDEKKSEVAKFPRHGGYIATSWDVKENSKKFLVKPYHPPLKYPSRTKQDLLEQEYRQFLEQEKDLSINTPFIESIAKMPTYKKFLTNHNNNQKELEKVSNVVLNEKFSVIVMEGIPTKMGDLGRLTLPCEFGNSTKTNALAYSGASFNLMPVSFYQKLNLPELKNTRMAIHMADQLGTYPRGIIEDLFIKIGNFVLSS